MGDLPTFPERFNLAHYYLDARVEEGRGDRVAVAVGDDEHTYADVQRRANRASHALRARGVDLEDRVLLLLFDGLPFVEAWFGTLKAGAVFCMANPLATAEELAYLVEYTRCRAIVADASVLARLPELPSRCRARFVVGADAATTDGAATEGFEGWEDALAGAADHTENADTLADDVAGWLFTSGTTGKPKGAVHFHRHFAFNTEVYAKRTLGLREDDVFVSVSRLFFGYGTGTNLMFPFAVGGKAVFFPDKPTPERIVEHVERHGVTVLTNVPAMIRQMLELDPSPALDSLRVCLSAGEALPPELLARWQSRWPHAEVLDGIGSAEMFHIYLTNKPGDVRPGSLGTPVEGYALRIVDADGNDVPDGEMGRLWVRGDSTALCYWNRQDASRATFHGDWCVTADLFRRDAEGYYWYAGRADDMLKVRGQFVSPLEIEDCLATHGAVKECAVIGVEDDAGLTIPKAFVVLREGVEPSDALVAELQAHAQARLTRYKFPRAVAFLPALPRNDRGKVLRRALR
ncbi:MAG: benzoate-CoA ligase family protein [Myxococcales bacterium]|nr:benzoate-CoA ligase family protein [Myxococcales bacterium]